MIELSTGQLSQAIKNRRYLHRNPELSFQEYDTTAFLVKNLQDLGFDVHQPMETGCIAVLRGDSPSERVVALRADIDALPIQESGDAKKEFFSTKDGIAHCCGHDMHTANLLGAAEAIAGHKEELEGTIILIFQAGEEKVPGGAKLLCETGFLDQFNIQRIYGLHTAPFVPVGNIAVKSGPFMARPDEFEVTVKGVGGHAASPHQTVDPIVLTSQMILAIQTIRSRNVDPTEPAVVTVGAIAGGSAHNIIPEEVFFKGTIRSFDDNTAELMSRRIEEIVTHTAKAAGGEAIFEFNEGYPAVINDEVTTHNVLDAAKETIGMQKVEMLQRPIMAGEDFAFYQQKFPGAFFFLGTGSEEADAQYSWHHPKYNVDERAFETGIKVMTWLALHG